MSLEARNESPLDSCIRDKGDSSKKRDEEKREIRTRVWIKMTPVTSVGSQCM